MPSAPQIGQTLAERYEIVSELGRGGMGVVFVARHTISGRRVALKWMEPDEVDGAAAKARFLREARAMGRIEHPNVVGVLDVGADGESAFLVMELLRGESLRAVIDAGAPLPPARVVTLLIPAMQGVEAAHRAGVVHRDLKPENLFVTRSSDGTETTKVLDFGISKVREDQREPVPTLTKTGHVVGTPQYMSPEQVRGAKVDVRTDVWALGVIAYEALTGRMPFEADNYGGLLVAIATEAYPPLDAVVPGTPLGLANAIHRALEKDPALRHPTVAAFAKALEPYAGGARFVEPASPSIAPPAPAARIETADAHARTGHAPSTPLLELEDVGRRPSLGTANATVAAKRQRPVAAEPAPAVATPALDAGPSRGRSAIYAAAIVVPLLVIGVIAAAIASTGVGATDDAAPAATTPAPVAAPVLPPPAVAPAPVVAAPEPPRGVDPPRVDPPPPPLEAPRAGGRRAHVVHDVPPAAVVEPALPPREGAGSSGSSGGAGVGRTGSLSRDDF